MRIPAGQQFGQTAPTVNPTRIGNPTAGAEGEAMQRLATAGLKLGESIEKQQEQDDQSQLITRVNELNALSTGLLHDPNNGLFSRQGVNAAGATEEYLAQYDAKANEILATLPTSVQLQFEAQAAAARISMMRSGLVHETSQRQQSDAANMSSLINNSSEEASGFIADKVNWQLKTGGTVHLINEYGVAHGQTDEQIREIQTNYLNTTAIKGYKNLGASDPGLLLQILGEPSDISASVRVPESGTTDTTRGIRNNNPGNIEFNDKNPWVGQTGSDGRFAQFATPEHGIRALGKNLLSYQRQGYDTVAEVANRWAPASDGNDTTAYIKALCEQLGVGADDQLDMTNIGTLKELCIGIMRQENSSTPYSDAQVTTGAMAALGITTLPDAGTKAINANVPQAHISPLERAQLQGFANNQLSQQLAGLRAQLDTELKDANAAFDQGLEPQSLPSQSKILTAYGSNQGAKVWQELQAQRQYGGHIATAKGLSPSGRGQMLNLLQPMPEDGPGYAANLQRWEKMGKAFSGMDKEWERNQGRVMVTNALNNGVALDPSNKSNKDAIDSYYDSNFSDFNINNNDDVNKVTSFVAKTGIIPTKLASQLNAASVAKDHNTVLPAAELVSRMYDTNPAVLSSMPKEKQSFYLNAKRLRDAGVTAEKAVEAAYDLAYNQTDFVKKQLSDEQSSSSYKKDRRSAASDFVSDRSQWFRRDPSVKDTNVPTKEFLQDYESLYDLNYRVSGGDADIAKKMTSQQISRAWSISEVNGSAQLMKYAPEAMHEGGPSGWQAQQWAEEKQRLTYGEKQGPIETSTNTLGVTSGRPGIATTTTPERKIKGDVILVPDVSTPRNGDYAIMISHKDKDGVPTLQPYFDADGRPLRYRPDLQSWKPYQDLVTDQKANVEQTMQKAQERRGFYDAHREFDEQYREGHEKRIEKQKTQLKNYFRWGKE